MIKAVALPYFVIAAAHLQDMLFTWGAVIAGIFLVLNQFGVLPRGKTFERVRNERDELERELIKKELELERQKARPDLGEVAKLVIDHDRRMMGIATGITDTLLAIAAAVLPEKKP